MDESVGAADPVYPVIEATLRYAEKTADSHLGYPGVKNRPEIGREVTPYQAFFQSPDMGPTKADDLLTDRIRHLPISYHTACAFDYCRLGQCHLAFNANCLVFDYAQFWQRTIMVRIGLLIGIVIMMVLIAINFLPDMTDSFHETVTGSYTTSGNVTTGVGVTTGEVTLDQELYNDNTGWVTSITSSYAGDSARVSSYASGNQTLAVAGLAASQNRLLTITYDYDNTSDFVGLEPSARMGPTILLFLIAIGFPVGIILLIYRERRR